MAYNLESLVKIIEQVMHPDYGCTLDPEKKPEIESLLNKARALKQLFGNNSSPLTAGNQIESLESRIRDAAYEAEDILESHLVDGIRSVGEGVRFNFSPPSLEKVIGEFDCAEEEIKKMMDIGSHIPVEDSSSSPVAASPSTDPFPKKIWVGLHEDSIQLKERLTRPEAKLETIPIVGMGGIGKTTLARSVYDDPFVVSHFDTRAWITISQAYNVRVILLGLLECIVGKLTNEMREKGNDQLAVLLHQSLFGRRYLIVLDDMWDDKAWDDIKMFFPDDNNGSRVMVTTREVSVANYAGSNSSPHHQMHLLDKNDSWNLLRQKVFGKETCPPELEKIGEKIAVNCRGLPLAIHVVGGVLSEAKGKREYWVQVAKDVASVIANKDEQFNKTLLLSYNHLPNHLKPCFLYMSAFPEDYEIRSSYLIRLWAAEGFLEPIPDKSLEEAAEMYLKALVNRNLIFVRRQEANGFVKSYGMHDLLRDLCVRKANQENFFWVKNRQVSFCPGGTSISLRRVSVDRASLSHLDDFYSWDVRLGRSFLCIDSPSLSREIFWSIKLPHLIRVLDILVFRVSVFPRELLKLVNLRYLAISCFSYIPPSISALGNLQTIILRDIIISGSGEEIDKVFDMPLIRHIKLLGTHTSYRPRDVVVRENLQTLSGIHVLNGFDRVIKSFPNLKKLGIVCKEECCINLKWLRKLETLKVETLFGYVVSHLILSPSLKKLTLRNCRIPLGYMNKIGTLPNLEVLKMRHCIFESSTWEPTEGEFCQLHFLQLEQLILVTWVADETHFPRLERLLIRGCHNLEEIPLGIGDIPTLEMIEVRGSRSSAVASAREIREKQLELGNYDLQVLISGASSQ